MSTRAGWREDCLRKLCILVSLPLKQPFISPHQTSSRCYCYHGSYVLENTSTNTPTATTCHSHSQFNIFIITSAVVKTWTLVWMLHFSKLIHSVNWLKRFSWFICSVVFAKVILDCLFLVIQLVHFSEINKSIYSYISLLNSVNKVS